MCNLAYYERKDIIITPQSVILIQNNINDSRKTWCKMDVSTPPSLDLACPQAKTEIEKHVHMLREREREVSIKTKYSHRSIMYIIITATNFIIELYHIASHEQVTIHHNIKVKSIKFIKTNKLCSQSTLQLQFIIFSRRVR